MSNKAILLRLSHYIKPHLWMFVLAIVGMLVAALTEPAVAAMMQPMIDGTFIEKDPHALIWVPLGFLILFFIRGLARVIAAIGLNDVSTRVVMSLRVDLHRKLQVLPQRFMDENSNGHLLSKFAYDVEQLSSAVSTVLLTLVRDSMIVIGLLVYMFYLSWELSLLVIMVTPVVALVTKTFSKGMRRFSRALQWSMGDLTHRLEENIRGHKLVKLYQAESKEAEYFYAVSNQLRRNRFRLNMLKAVISPIVQMIIAIALSAAVYFAASMEGPEAMSAGAFVSFFFAMGMLFSPVKSLTSVLEPFQRGKTAAESLFNLIDQLPEQDTGTTELTNFTGRLVINELSFRYRDDIAPVLDHISLQIEPGETIALVGPSGSGKTTLTQLIPRFYEPQEGQLLFDGHDSRDLTLTSLRQQIAYVDQEVMLFDMSVAENVAYGQTVTPDLDRVREALIHAHAWEFVEALEQGVHTKIGEEGSLLSGGQRQRLALARAFYKDAPLLILDEATSALDNESERQVQLALDELCQNRTTLIIAHRLSTIEHADRIVVMENGHILESGDHATLMAKQGAYYQLYQHLH